jgi:hypothetical protein
MGRYDLITFSFGGDDIGFPSIVQHCLDKQGCPPDQAVRKKIADLGTTGVYKGSLHIPSYPTFLQHVAQAAATKGGNVVVMGYPEIVEVPTLWPSGKTSCAGFSVTGANTVRGWAGDLNATIGNAVAQVNGLPPSQRNGVHFTFIDPVTGQSANGISPSDLNLFEPSSGTRHELCSEGHEAWVNGFSNAHPLTRSFHPNQPGEDAMGNLAVEAIRGLIWPWSPTTKVVQYSPVDSGGMPLAGLDVVQGGTATTCEAGSDTVGNAYRCFAGNDVYDPCWTDSTDPATPAALCLEQPWDTQATQLTLSQGGLPPFLQAPAPLDLDFPWGVQLSSGAHCLAVQGSHDDDNGTIVDYSCDRNGQVLLRGVDRTQPQWTYSSAYFNASTDDYASGPTVRVTEAWYAIPDDRSEKAALANICSASALAFAAQAYEAANNNPDGAIPEVNAQACDGGYAIMVYTQSAPPPGYTASMLFKATQTGWQHIGGADYISPGDFGLPVDVGNQIQTTLSASPMNEQVPF